MNRTIEMDSHKFGLLGAGIAGAACLFELIRSLASRATLGGWSPGLSRVASVIFVVLFAVTAVGLALHRRFGWGVGVAAFVVSLGYGGIVAAGGAGHGHHRWAVVYFLFGGALFGALTKSLPYFRAAEPRGLGFARG